MQQEVLKESEARCQGNKSSSPGRTPSDLGGSSSREGRVPQAQGTRAREVRHHSGQGPLPEKPTTLSPKKSPHQEGTLTLDPPAKDQKERQLELES